MPRQSDPDKLQRNAEAAEEKHKKHKQHRTEDTEKLVPEKEPKKHKHHRIEDAEFARDTSKISDSLHGLDPKSRLEQSAKQKGKQRKGELGEGILKHQKRLHQLEVQADVLSKRSSISPSDRKEFADNAQGLATSMVNYAQENGPDLYTLEKKGKELQDFAKQLNKTTTTKDSKSLLGLIKDCLKSIMEFIKEILGISDNKQTHHQEMVSKRSAERTESKNI